MKAILVISFLVVFSFTTFGQNTSLPEVLVPSKESVTAAKAVGAKVFKLLPRGLYDQPLTSRVDSDNQLGIRGGGAYYSFTTGSHSYDKIPEIQLGRDSVSVGFAGLNYGFITDLGKLSLENVSADLPQLLFLSTYSPPHLIPDIRSEQTKKSEYKADGFVYRRRLEYIVGNTYALRAISYDDADVLVGFTIIAKNDDASLEIIWKPIKTFEKPLPWYLTDEEIREKLPALLVGAEYSNITASVKDNVITLRGTAAQVTIQKLENQLQSLRASKIINEVTLATPARTNPDQF